MRSDVSSLAMAVLLAAVATACGRSSSAPERLVVVSASPNPAVLRQGDTTRISVTVLNAGDRSLTIDATACPSWFEVLKDTTVLAPGVQACSLVMDLRTVEPGASYTHVFTWRGERFLSPETPVPLDEGNYTLRPAVRVEGRMVRGEPVPIQIIR